MRGSLVLFALAAVGLGCSSSSSDSGKQAEADSPGWIVANGASGSRLRARVVSGGGAREVLGFYDTERKEECTFQQAGGRWRCLPEAVYQQIGGLFSDAQCRVPLQVGSACGPEPKYVISVGGVGCDSNVVSTIRAVTGVVPTTYVQTGTGGCQTNTASTSNAKGFVVGPELSLDGFVGADETRVQNGALTETVLVGTDGSRQHLDYRIEALNNVECTFQVMSDGITRCVPRAQATQILYLDSECTNAAYAFSNGSGSCGESSSFVREYAPNGGCSAIRSIFRAGEGPAGDPNEDPSDPNRPTLYSTQGSTGPSGNSCVGSTYYSARYARPITKVTASLPSIDRVGRGDARLVPTLVTKAGSEDLVAGWHDYERNTDCTFERASDNKLRCLPTGANGLVFFGDAQCKSDARVVVRSGPLSCAQASSKYVRVTPAPAQTNPPTGCSPTANETITRVFELSPEVKNFGVSSFESTPGRCAQVAGVNGGSDAKELDPALFVEGVAATE